MQSVWIAFNVQKYVWGNSSVRLINRTKSDTVVSNRAELLGTFIEVSSEAFFIFDSNMSSVEMNHAALKLAGVSAKHAVGSELSVLLPTHGMPKEWLTFRQLSQQAFRFGIVNISICLIIHIGSLK